MRCPAGIVGTAADSPDIVLGHEPMRQAREHAALGADVSLLSDPVHRLGVAKASRG